jgi:hypothetical protein
LKANLLLGGTLLFILTANGVLPGGSGNTIRHNKQVTHITQNNTMIKRNTAHETTHTIKDTLHRMNTNNHNYMSLPFSASKDMQRKKPERFSETSVNFQLTTGRYIPGEIFITSAMRTLNLL